MSVSLISSAAPELPDAEDVRAPSAVLRHTEVVRAAGEYLATALSGTLTSHWPKGDGHPVMVLPGFLATGRSTIYLRSFLRNAGYRAYDWGLHRNLGVRPGLRENVAARLEELVQRNGRKVSLIGWSAGGIYAREVARAFPDQVRCVITLGSPIRGNHQASHAWRLWSLLNTSSEAKEGITAEGRAAREQPLTVPTTCIYSRRDGVVAWQCCMSRPARLTENVEVDSAHVGFGHNLETLYVIADRLAQPEGRWRPLAASSGE